MGEALFDLEQILRSNKVNTISSQETNILMSCKAQAVRDFFISTGGSAVVSWLATRRLSNIVRINLTAGISGACGFWMFGRSLDSCIDHILSMEGTRIKNELAKIVLTKYQDDPSVMQRISKHFYSENVYDDSSSDLPKLRWRMRNFFAEYPDSERTRMHDYQPYNELTDEEKTNLQQEQVYLRTSTIDAMMDPFDCVFGLPPEIQDIRQSDASDTPHKRNGRSQKRSHRRYRKRHQEMSEA